MNKLDLDEVSVEKLTQKPKSTADGLLKINHKPSGASANISRKQLQNWLLRQLREAIK